MCTTFALAIHLLVVPGLGPGHGCCGQCWNYKGLYWSPIYNSLLYYTQKQHFLLTW